MSQTFHIVTLGCAKNYVDSEQIYGLLSKEGFIQENKINRAAIIILNTCGFIASAQQESIETLLELTQYKKTGSCRFLIMVGCLVQKYSTELKEALPEVDLFLGTGDLPLLPELIPLLPVNKQKIWVSQPENFLYDDTLKKNYALQRSYAYVKIAEGCNNFCTYCVIPQLRGAYRSRTIEAIVAEVKALTAHGISEIILIAQDTTFYGFDLAGKYLLPELLRQLVTIPQLHWLRLHYCYPEHLTEELLQVIREEEKICKYLDLPLQHIARPILTKMGRPLSPEKIKALLAKIRGLIPNITLRSTFIVGFPGETEEDFQKLLAFLEETKFDRAGLFAYSREPGTPAALLPQQINPEEKLRRLTIATQQQEKILATRQNKFVGQTVEVILDNVNTNAHQFGEGRTRSDSPEIDCLVCFPSNLQIKIGEIKKMKITHSENYILTGEIKHEFSE